MLENFEVIDFLPPNNFVTEVKTEHTNLSTGTLLYIAIPDKQNGLGIVYHPDIFGLTPLVDDTIFQIAARGVPTIAIDPFTRLEKNGPLTREEKLFRINEMNDIEQCADILGAAQILRTKHNCEKVALIGFCIGGMYAFKTSGVGLFDCVISCYGMITMPDTWKSDTQKEPLDYLSMESVSPVLAIIGGQDKGYAKADDVEKLLELFSKEAHKLIGSHVEIFPEAGHAFMHNPQHDNYREQDSKAAWNLAFEFITEKTGLRI
jgi:carboxymethylenebutenolidase